MKIVVFCEKNPSMLTPEGLAAYPEGMGVYLKNILSEDGNDVTYIEVTDDGEQNYDEDVLKGCDVAVWWGHWYHDRVSDKLVDQLVENVQKGMGLICLHSAHRSKPFLRLLGTTGCLKWREDAEKERVWCVDLTHPINKGVGEFVDVAHEEMYGEPFDIPTPDELVYLGWFQGGEVLRSGCVFKRGRGKLFYFNPGHETYPTYKNPSIVKILKNACEYLKPTTPLLETIECHHIEEYSIK